jgi:hypothetical protein
MQAIDMGNHFLRRCLATEIATEQLVRPFGGSPAYPQIDQQAGNQHQIDLQRFRRKL